LADETELFDFAQETLRQFGLKMKPKRFLRLLSLKKTGLDKKDKKDEEVSAEDAPKFQAACEAYESRLTQEKIMDYDDLLIQTLLF
jgi:superfamily I DNA/RNA helicase